MKFKLKDVLPNPHRDLKMHPLVPAKVSAIKESVEATGFWPNLIGRLVKGKTTQVELGYGHHRAEALRLLKIDEVEITIEDRTDAEMLQIMARENNEAYSHDLGATIESVRAAVRAIADGTVVLPELPERTNDVHIRYAPSFVAGVSSNKLLEHPYTATSLATFLGCTDNSKDGAQAQRKIVAALAALELEELKIAGFDAKGLNAYRQPDGSIPVDRVLKATRDIKVRAEVTKKRAAERAEAQRIAGLSLQQRIEEERKERDRLAALDVLQRKQRMAATDQEDTEKAARLLEEQKQRAIDAAAAEVRRKELAKEFTANQKEREASLAAQRKAVENDAKRAEAGRAAFHKTFVDATERISTGDEPRYANGKSIGKDKRTTDKERNTCLKAIDAAMDRLEQEKVFFRPPVKK